MATDNNNFISSLFPIDSDMNMNPGTFWIGSYKVGRIGNSYFIWNEKRYKEIGSSLKGMDEIKKAAEKAIKEIESDFGREVVKAKTAPPPPPVKRRAPPPPPL